MIGPRAVHLLYVDDDDLCQMMLCRTFSQAKFSNPIVCAQSGSDALDMLRGANGRERFPRPFLILTDLSMSRMSGIELVQELRQDEDLKKSIVFVLSTSNAEKHKVEAYNLGVAGYILKTNPHNALLEAAALLETYCRVVEFPAS